MHLLLGFRYLFCMWVQHSPEQLPIEDEAMWDKITQAVSATRTRAQDKNCYLYLGIFSESG